MHRNITHWQWLMLAVFSVALLTRGLYALTLQEGFYFPDSSDYDTAAVSLLESGEFGKAYKRPPVYPVFLAAIYALVGPNIPAVRAVQVVMGAGLAVMLASMAKRVGGPGVGVVAGLLWGVYPLGILIAGLVYPETVATLLLATAVWVLFGRADWQDRPRQVLVAGLLFGLAALAKPVALATIAVMTLWLAYWCTQRWRTMVLLFLLGAALPLTPWTIRNYQVYGRMVVVEPRLVAHLPKMGESPRQLRQEGGKLHAIFKRPGRFMAHFVKEFGHFWELYPTRIQMSRSAYREKMHRLDDRIVVEKTVAGRRWTTVISIMSTVPMFGFALLGAGAMARRQACRRDLSLLLLLILSFAAGYAIFIAKIRYRIPIEPYILILSAYGLQQTWALCTKRRGPRERDEEAVASVAD